MESPQPPVESAKPSIPYNPRMGLWERLYLAADFAAKLVAEFCSDIITTLVILFGTLAGGVGRAFFGAVAWTLALDRSASNPLTRLIRRAVGVLLITPLFLLSSSVLLLGGSIASILGFRDTVEYPVREQVAAWVFFLVVLLSLPLFLSNYALFKISLVFAYALGVIGLDFLYGQCGILSMGHGGFLLMGSYMTIWLYNGTFGAHLPMTVAVPLAALAMIPLGIVLGAPSLRIRDHYLVIVTITFSLAMPKFMKSEHFAKWSGVRDGGLFLDSLKPFTIFEKVPAPVQVYFIVILSALALFVIAYNLVNHSQIGKAFKTIRCDHEVSMIMGIPVVRYKLLAFIMSAVYGGFCGAFLTILTKFAHPEGFNFQTSVNFLVAIVIGGPGSLLGSLLGGVFLTYEPDMTMAMSQITKRGKDLATGFYGLLLVFAVLFAPGGLAGAIAGRVRSRFQTPVRRGLYQFAPPADYDFLPEDKKNG